MQWTMSPSPTLYWLTQNIQHEKFVIDKSVLTGWTNSHDKIDRFLLNPLSVKLKLFQVAVNSREESFW